MTTRTVQLLGASSFSPGLRLDVDAFQLGDGESPDLLNVDLDPRGGVALRRAVTAANQSSLFTTPIHSLFDFAKTDGTEQILVGSGLHTYFGTGSTFTSIGTVWTVTSRQRATSFADALYIQNGTDAPRKWTGSAVSNLTQTFNDNIQAPDNGDMPIAKCITAWQGYVWVANTFESATRFGSRVRFSHPNKPEDWRTDDFIDLDVGHDGDEITALVPLADRLLVFKNHSVHQISGDSPDNFAVNFVASVGTPSQEATCTTEYGVYFFSWPEGLHFYGDRGVSFQFDALFPAIRDGDIPDAFQSEITVGWLGRRVFVGVPWGASTKNARTFVLTPGKGNGWTQYDLPLGPMLEWRRRASDTLQLAATSGATASNRVLRLDQDADTDQWYTDHMALSGASTTYASTTDSAATSITGDIDIRALVAPTDWTPAANQIFVSKLDGYEFYLKSNGRLELFYKNGAAVNRFNESTVATGLTDGTLSWVRVTRNAATGSVNFYLSTDGVTWNALGGAVAGVAEAAVDGTTGMRIGARSQDGTLRFIGKFYYAEVRNGIAGTVVASPDFTAQNPGTTVFNDAQGNTWTLTGAATLSAQDTNIDSYYMTRWFDAGSPAVIKRWKRPDLVFDADHTAQLRVGVYRDYEPTVETKWFNATITSESSGMLWGSGTWGTSLWGASGVGAQVIDRGGLLGRARAISLKFTGPTPSARWSVNSVNFKYIPRRVR